MPDYSHTNPLVHPDEVEQWIEGLAQPIAITGGTGFIGSHLVDTLCAAGVETRVLVRNPTSPRWIGDAPVTFIEGSLDNGDAVNRLVEGAGTVLHLAGVVRAGSEAEFDAGNRGGTASLIRAVDEAAPGVRVVHVSSLAAVGPSPDPEGVGPEAEPAPISSYGRSKLAAEGVVRERRGEGGWAIVRPPAVYGPRDTDIFEFFKMIDRGAVVLPAGERWITVVWVGDVVRSILSAAAGPLSEIYHLGEHDPVLMKDLVAELCASGSREARIIPLPAAVVTGAGMVGSFVRLFGFKRLPLTRDKARELLARHWTSRTLDSNAKLDLGAGTPFAEGAKATWLWYRERGWLAT